MIKPESAIPFTCNRHRQIPHLGRVKFTDTRHPGPIGPIFISYPASPRSGNFSVIRMEVDGAPGTFL
jgi:hypothetical protein